MILKETGKVLCVLLLSAFMTSSCQTDGMLWERSQSQPVEVGFYAGDALTRTTILPNGLSAVWQPGDQLALWARNSAGDFVLQNQIFRTFGLGDKRGFFTSTLASDMPESNYTYYVCYPAPTSVNGTQATFGLPSVQDGKASSGADIMVSNPVQHGPLTSVSKSGDQGYLSMQMNRMMHQFRFYVPSEDSNLNGESIERIVLSFPTPVVGNVQLDLTDPSKSAVLLSGYRDVNLNLEEPLTREAQNFACVSFVPTKFTAGQYLDIKAYTDDMIVELDPIDLCAKNCLAGHSTPVMLIVKALKEYPWQIKVRLSANNLGENVKSISFNAPGGCVWPDSNSNVYTYNPGREINVGDEFVFRFADEAQYRAFSKQNIAITYDSDNAITYQNITMPDLSVNDKVSVSLTVPYLFSEDFSTIADFNFDVVTNAQGTAVTGYDLSIPNSQKKNVNPGLRSGWTGARTGGGVGQSIRVGSRVDRVWGYTHTYGRLDSPAMSALKDGVEVTVSVMFNYSGGRDGDKGYSPRAVVGYTTSEGPINGKTGSFSSDEDGWENILDPILVPSISVSGTYSSITQSMSTTMSGFTNQCRLSWMIRGSGAGGFISNGNQWMYIDNIRVKIAK